MANWNYDARLYCVGWDAYYDAEYKGHPLARITFGVIEPDNRKCAQIICAAAGGRKVACFVSFEEACKFVNDFLDRCGYAPTDIRDCLDAMRRIAVRSAIVHGVSGISLADYLGLYYDNPVDEYEEELDWWEAIVDEIDMDAFAADKFIYPVLDDSIEYDYDNEPIEFFIRHSYKK